MFHASLHALYDEHIVGFVERHYRLSPVKSCISYVVMNIQHSHEYASLFGSVNIHQKVTFAQVNLLLKIMNLT